MILNQSLVLYEILPISKYVLLCCTCIKCVVSGAVIIIRIDYS